MFIVIEGIDGAGKGYQRNQLVKYLSKDHIVETTDFPDHKGVLYKHIIHPAISKELEIDDKALFLSFALDQLLWQNTIAKYKGSATKHFIVDGYYTTAIVYQCFLAKLFSLEQVLHFAQSFGIAKPDYSVFLDVDPKTAFERKLSESGHDEGLDIFESDIDKQATIRDGFKKMVKENIFGKWGMVDGSGTKQEVTNLLIKTLKSNSLI